MKAIHIIGSLLTAGLILSGCDNSSNTIPGVLPGSDTQTSDAEITTTAPVLKSSYKVTFKNLTYAQPMAPMAVAYHSKDVSIFEVGKSAGLGLEKLAEGGDNSELLSELSENVSVASNIGGTGLILPSQSDTVTIEGNPSECISVVAMLVNTNDAFAGVDCVDVVSLKKGETMMLTLPTYDAGTESNSETGASIPGPAGGGEGFNASRDDRDFVSVHSGVLTQDDGLITSALTEAHKWDNPAASVMIERIE
jgi:hypothetical protein